MLSRTISSVTENELAFIAALDYGLRTDEHLAALRQVVFEQDGIPTSGQYVTPYEVIELGAHHLAKGHDREFAICTLLVIRAVESGYDEATDLSQKFHDRAADYGQLPTELRDEILDAYSRARLAPASGLLSSYRRADE